MNWDTNKSKNVFLNRNLSETNQPNRIVLKTLNTRFESNLLLSISANPSNLAHTAKPVDTVNPRSSLKVARQDLSQAVSAIHLVSVHPVQDVI